MFIPRFALFLVPAALLSACGESTGGSTGTPINANSFAEYDQIGLDLTDAAITLGFTDPASLPTSGSANYLGVMGVAVDPGSPDAITAIGALEMTVQFGSDSLSGRVTDVIDEDDGRYQGTLSITNGDINRAADVTSEFTYFADLDGTLVSPDGQSLTVDALMAGDLLGPGSYTEGGVSGFVTSANGTSSLEGGYIAERQ